jgi:hypothetical protein
MIPTSGSLSQMLDVKKGPSTPGCDWSTGRLGSDPGSVERAAQYLALEAMRMRCRPASTFALWDDTRRASSTLVGKNRGRVEPFIRTVLGLPGTPLPDDHIQGWVAEVTWYLVLRDHVPKGRTLAYLTPPSFHVTGPGADGLAVYAAATQLIFRLWEIKKHHGVAHVSSTVSRAYSQLDERATEYLAQLTGLADQYGGALADVLGRLVDLWVDADGSAGAGVAVSTSNSKHPKKCFSTMNRAFPQFADAGQLEGLVVGLGDLPSFASRVREIVWSVL